MSVSQRLGAFLRKYKFFITLVVFQGRGRQSWEAGDEDQGPAAPGLPATQGSLQAIHRPGANKGKTQCRRLPLCYF